VEEEFLSVGGTFSDDPGYYYLGVNTSEGLWGELKLDKTYWVVMKGPYNAEGGVVDGRNVRFNLWEEEQEQDLLSFFLKLEDSKMIKSLLKWSPQLMEKAQARIQKKREEIMLTS
jgi:hypothetical protein